MAREATYLGLLLLGCLKLRLQVLSKLFTALQSSIFGCSAFLRLCQLRFERLCMSRGIATLCSSLLGRLEGSLHFQQLILQSLGLIVEMCIGSCQIVHLLLQLLLHANIAFCQHGTPDLHNSDQAYDTTIRQNSFRCVTMPAPALCPYGELYVHFAIAYLCSLKMS